MAEKLICRVLKNYDSTAVPDRKENYALCICNEPPLSEIKEPGIKAVIAQSVPHIFFRNAVNFGITVIESPNIVEKIADGDVIEINSESGSIFNLTGNEVYSFPPIPFLIREIISCGGLMNFAKNLQRIREEMNL